MLRAIELPELTSSEPRAKETESLLMEAARRIDEFLYQRGNEKFHSFVASDFRAVDRCLAWIVDRRHAAGNSFCEWGCGFGVVAMLAAMRGFDACGIEVEKELVDNARRLADEFSIEAEFIQGSFVPEQAEVLVSRLRDIAYVHTQSASTYEELGLDMDDFDLIYAYPWPGEERFYEMLFDRFAANGALLMTYHGIEGLRLQRKVKR